MTTLNYIGSRCVLSRSLFKPSHPHSPGRPDSLHNRLRGFVLVPLEGHGTPKRGRRIFCVPRSQRENRGELPIEIEPVRGCGVSCYYSSFNPVLAVVMLPSCLVCVPGTPRGAAPT
jgi:hypothetical protein